MVDTIPVWAQWFFGGGVLTIIVGAVGGWIKLARPLDRMDLQFDRVDTRLERLDQHIEQLRIQGNGHLSLTGSLVAALNRNQAINADEFAVIIQNFVELGG